MTGEPILTVRNLRCTIGGQQVVEDVTFDVPATGITAVLGRNGVGKTSTLRGILGLVSRRGEVRLAGERIDALPTHRIVRRGVGYVPEDREVFSKLTVAENLALAERQRNPRREFVAELFPDLVARRDQAAGTLSGGQQQRLALARAWALHPEVLLLDEPTASLDPTAKREVEALIAEAAAGRTLIFASHNLGQVKRLATRVVYLEQGRVVADLPVHDFFHGPLPEEAHLFVKGELA